MPITNAVAVVAVWAATFGIMAVTNRRGESMSGLAFIILLAAAVSATHYLI